MKATLSFLSIWIALAVGALAQLPSVVGEWSPVSSWPAVTVHTSLLPNGRVITHPYSDEPRVWDPATGQFTNLPASGYNIFCTGHTLMGDGRVIFSGGHIANGVGEARATIYDPVANAWTRLPNMNAGRWYPTMVTLPSGDVVTMSGSIDNTVGNNNIPQVWQNGAGSWRTLTGAGNVGLPLYPFAHLAPDGRVFVSGPNQTTYYLNTGGTGAWTTVGPRRDRNRNYGSSVMYEPGKVLTMGGGDPPLASAEVIDLRAATPAWRTVGSLATARRQINATVLPDGKVFVTGGSNGPGFNNANFPVLTTEMWDPVTETWSTMASITHYRGYHSTALLLPDGRVLSSGGDDFPDAEIFSPPHLFQGVRPSIASAPAEAAYGQAFSVVTPDAAAITQVTLVRLSSVTHAFNTSQRFLRANFTRGTGQLSVTAPSSASECPPGHYMLFVLNSQGVPSVARIVRIGATVTRPAAPAAPSGLTVTGVANNQANLSWLDNSNNETTFVLERRIAVPPGAWSVIATLGPGVRTFSDTGLAPATTYAWRVRAENAGGSSAWSNEAQATTTSTTFTDTFDDGVRDSSKWVVGTIAGTIYFGPPAFDTAITVREAGGRLEILPRTNVSGDHYSGYVSASTWNLTNSAVSVEALPAPGGGTDTILAVCIDNQNFAMIVREGDGLYFDQVEAGNRLITGLTYNATQHRFWRIRHSNAGGLDTISFETSATGTSWTVQRTDPRDIPVTAMRIELSAGTWQPEPAPGIAAFDNFRLDGVGGPPPPPPANEPPIANPGGPYTATAGQPVTLDGRQSSDPDGTIVSYAWEFGDTTTATGAQVTHTYTTPNTYQARLTVTDDRGGTASQVTNVVVNPPAPNQLPTARPGGPYSAPPEQAIQFDGTLSTDPDGVITEWQWSFGDGNGATGSRPTHSYAAAGTYTVSLTVIDNRGGSGDATTTASITVPPPPPPPGSGLVSDNFDDNSRDAQKWVLGSIVGTIYAGPAGVDPAVTVLERNQRLEITPRSSLFGDRYNGYLSAAPLDFTGAHARVHVVEVVRGSSDAILAVCQDSRNLLMMGYELGILFFDQISNGSRDVGWITYDPALHRYWRIRHAAATDTIAYETSPDGIAWTTWRTVPRRIPITALRVELSAGTYESVASPGVAIFDDLSVGR